MQANASINNGINFGIQSHLLGSGLNIKYFKCQRRYLINDTYIIIHSKKFNGEVVMLLTPAISSE